MPNQAAKVPLTFVVPALLLVPSVIHLVYLTANHQVWGADQSAYGIASLELWNSLAHHFSSWMTAALNAIWITRPPLIAWLGEFFVPIGQLLHSIDLGLSLLIITTQYANLALTYCIGKELGQGRTVVALCACLAMAAAPLFVWHSTQYLVEPFQLLATIYAYWIAAKMPSLKPLKAIAHVMFAISIALLSKASSILYCAVPILLVLATSLRLLWLNARRDRAQIAKQDVIFVIAAAMCVYVSVVWYLHNFSGIYAVARDASFGAPALNYGHRGLFISKLSLWAATSSRCFFRPWFDIAVLGVILIPAFVGLIRHLWRIAAIQSIQWSYRRVLAVAALLELLLIFAALSLNIGECDRYILASLPSLIVLLSIYLSRCINNVVSFALLSLFAAQFFVSTASELEPLKAIPAMSNAPPSQKVIDTEITHLVRFLASKKQSHWAVVGVSYSWLNSNILNYYTLKEVGRSWRPCRFVGLPILSSAQMDSAIKIIDSVKPQFFVFVDPSMPPILDNADFANQLKPQLWKMALERKNFKRIPFSSKIGIAVFRISGPS